MKITRTLETVLTVLSIVIVAASTFAIPTKAKAYPQGIPSSLSCTDKFRKDYETAVKYVLSNVPRWSTRGKKLMDRPSIITS